MKTRKFSPSSAKANRRRSSRRLPRWIIVIIVWAVVASVIAAYAICSMHASIVWAFVTAVARSAFEFRKVIFEAALETWCFIMKMLGRER